MAKDEKPAAIKESEIYRNTVSAAKSLAVFEGLPHQMWDSELFSTEIKREDIRKIWNHPFYTPSVDAKNDTELRKLLSSPKSIVIYGGPKYCGGYHPDYCISWQADKDTYYALICFGCQEVVFHDGKTYLIYDLSENAHKRYKELLSVYQAKRPRTEK